MSSREPRRTGRPPDEEKRQAVIIAAKNAFFEHGYAACSLESVAAAAGVSKVTIYNQFGGKAGLFTAAVNHECESIRSKLLFSTEEVDIAARLTSVAEALHAFLFRPEMRSFELRIAAETQRDPSIGQAFMEAGPNRMKAALVDVLEAARDRGELAFADGQLVAEQFAAMVKGMADLEWRFLGKLDPAARDRRIAAAVTVILTCYAPG